MTIVCSVMTHFVDFYINFMLRQWTGRVDRARIIFSHDDWGGSGGQGIGHRGRGHLPPCHPAGAADATAARDTVYRVERWNSRVRGRRSVSVCRCRRRCRHRRCCLRHEERVSLSRSHRSRPIVVVVVVVDLYSASCRAPNALE